MNNFIEELTKEHRSWLSSFPAQFGKNWEKILRSDLEAAWAEAGVRRKLQAQGVTVSPNEDLSGTRKSPDFRCDAKGCHFYVEVASISREKANEKTGFRIDGEAHRFVPLIQPIVQICIDKASQCSGQDAPVLLACATFSESALLAFSPPYPRMLLAGIITSSVQIDPATGEFVGGINQSTNLQWSAFYRFTPDGEEIETARSSISGLLLCAPGVGDGYTVGILNPDAIRPFAPSVLPGIPFETAQVEIETGTFRFNQTEKEES